MKGFGLKPALLATCASFVVTLPAYAQDAQILHKEDVIVVTAQNREQDVTDVPIAIEVVGAEELGDAGITDFRDLTRVAPVLNVTQDAQFTRVAIRGVGTNSNDEAQDQSIAVNIDGEYINRPNILNISLFDLDRVEVLRGPQGTLYGRNATGGAINFITRKPGNDLTVNASATYGNFDHVLLEAGVDLPFGDLGGVRVAGIYNKHDGYFFHPNREAAGSDRVGTGTGDNQGVRLSLRLNPTDALTVDLAGEYVHNENIVPAFSSYNFDQPGAGPGIDCSQNGFVDAAPLIPGGQCIPLRTNSQATFTDRSSYEGPLPVYALNKNLQDSYAVRGKLEYDFGGVVLSYIGGWRKTNGDVDLNLPNYVFQEWLNKVKTQSHEIRLANSGATDFQWQLGVFYFDENIDNLRGLFSAFIGPNGSFLNTFARDVNTTSYAAFGQIEYPVSDEITLVGGLRYTWDERDAIYGNYGFRFNVGPVAPTGPAPSVLDLAQSNEKLTWLAGVNYEPDADTLIYAKVSTGYKAGGFDSVGPYDPETNTAYEVGAKVSFGPSGQHQLNSSAFYYDYKDLQTAVLLDTTIGNQVFNAGKATIWGVEVEGSFELAPNSVFSASVNYLNAEYNELLASYAIFDTAADSNTGLSDLDPGPTIVQPNLAGNKPPQSPEWTITVGYDHIFDIGNSGTVTFSAFTRFKSDYFLDIFNYQDSEQEAFTQTDLSLKYMPLSEQWSVQAFIRNLEDEKPLTFAGFVAAGPDDVYNYGFGTPRTYGVRVAVDF